jgi:hypothetical protein
MATDADSAKLVRQTTAAAGALVVVIAVAAVAVWARRPRLEPIEVSQQTTYLITPTRADGWVDYPEAVDWMRRASLDAGGANAALPLVRALGRDVLPIGVDRAALLSRLHIEAGAADASALPPLKDVQSAAGQPIREPTPAAIEWVRARCPADAQVASFGQITGWLTQSDGPIADLRTAAEAASLYVPVPRGGPAPGNFDRVNPIRLADGAAALACDAAMKLLGGDPAASWNDADALWRLGQLVARAATAGEYAVAEVFWKAALTATVDLVASEATPSDLLSTMQARLGAKLGFAPATEAWMFHRLEALEANGTPLVSPPTPANVRPAGGPRARIGATAKLEAINRDFDAVDAALQTPDPKERIARVDQAAARIGGAARGMLGTEIQAASYRRLASLAVAVARRKRDGGRLPASLAELPEAPKDPGSGGSFSYIPAAAGRFRLYGVGADGNDDHGDPTQDAVADATAPPVLATR